MLPKKVKKILREPINPPTSKRFCLYCDKITKFKYNPSICHSCCVICGSHFSKTKRRKNKDKQN